ncbi:hypothetical protein DL89DRAFT_292431 [Linderina pennispora]|uniref:Chromatin modification-related protein n=1 Tax=Linderina pennispora TaxID=61395 RepID=A0A1Y1WBZ2_9FUNG|nr:uncharacterized protein DL89DRAFT_292431 [Linderina pennispora]ORX70838.1 hypothetical protein DL89DRAFT_292431 [Linderina pennispora]
MEDIGLALADFVSNMENVPSEIRHLFSEITDLDEKYAERSEKQHADAKQFSLEKIRLTKKAMTIVQRHLTKLDAEIRQYDKSGESTKRIYTPLAFRQPKRMESVPGFSMDGDGGFARSAPKRRHMGGQAPRHKKQLKMASIVSLDGFEEAGAGIEESDDQLYCFCQQVSYGDMVACDGNDCRYEWFHWECVGLTSPPKGSWYCQECLAKLLDDDEA